MADANLSTRKREINPIGPGEAKAWQYYVLHDGDRPAQRHVHEKDWPTMHRFENEAHDINDFPPYERGRI